MVVKTTPSSRRSTKVTSIRHDFTTRRRFLFKTHRAGVVYLGFVCDRCSQAEKHLNSGRSCNLWFCHADFRPSQWRSLISRTQITTILHLAKIRRLKWWVESEIKPSAAADGVFFLIVLLQKTLINTGLDTIIAAGIIHLTDYRLFDEIAHLFSFPFYCTWEGDQRWRCLCVEWAALTSIYCFPEVEIHLDSAWGTSLCLSTLEHFIFYTGKRRSRRGYDGRWTQSLPLQSRVQIHSHHCRCVKSTFNQKRTVFSWKVWSLWVWCWCLRCFTVNSHFDWIV